MHFSVVKSYISHDEQLPKMEEHLTRAGLNLNPWVQLGIRHFLVVLSKWGLEGGQLQVSSLLS
jgi:hypothetical protein